MNNWLLEQLCQPENESMVLQTNPKAHRLLQDILEGVRADEEDRCEIFHRLLYALNRKRLSVNGCETFAQEQSIRNAAACLEAEWLRLERARIAPQLLNAPTQPHEFLDWFENLEQTGYGQDHALFRYLAEQADWHEIRYFFRQEFSTEAGFDDLVALTQIKSSPQVKMELAHNFWDEMGRGNPKGVHGFLLQRVSDHFSLREDHNEEDIHWAPLALANVMIAFAASRTHFYQSIGALGVIELTAPGRCIKIIQGLHRVGVSREDYHYYSLHSSLDRKHWAGWKENVMKPLILEKPASTYALAEGALLRLHAGARCFEAYANRLMPNLNCDPTTVYTPAG